MYNKPFAKEIQTDELCNYGCKTIAKFKFRNGKLCCSKHHNTCKGKRKWFSENVNHKEYAAKSLKTRIKLGITKTSQIKGGKTRVEQGHYKKLSKRMKELWKENPWNNHGPWRKYKDTDINVQSKYEENFIEEAEKINGIDWVKNNIKRGPSIWYVDPNTNNMRLYLSDFIIDNTVFEIKSDYWWNKNGTDNELEQLNLAKLEATKDQGYCVILVKEGKRTKI